MLIKDFIHRRPVVHLKHVQDNDAQTRSVQTGRFCLWTVTSELLEFNPSSPDLLLGLAAVWLEFQDLLETTAGSHRVAEGQVTFSLS